MPILKYIPKKKNVIDRRSNEGGFYEAECDECGGKFYPKRNNAKYCSQSCQQMAWRRIIKDKKVKPKAVKESKPIVEPKPTNIKRFTTQNDVVLFFKQLKLIGRGDIEEFRFNLKFMEVGETAPIGKYILSKTSPRIYELKF